MKKAMWSLLILCAAPGLFAQEANGSQETNGSQAVIREITGTVEIKAPNAADWSPAARGQALTQNTLISTGFKSSALIAIGNSTLSVQSLTRLSLEEIIRSEGDEKVALNLRTGRVRANVKPPVGGKTDFTVRSPSATASVRGTVFEFNGIQIRVDEGRVHLAGDGGSGIYVGAGHLGRTDIETGHTVGPVETAREEVVVSVPAGVDSAPEVKTAPPSVGDIDAGFDWK
jgi:ferric-dicitrate binding protein FerR (iron transport regulator)